MDKGFDYSGMPCNMSPGLPPPKINLASIADTGPVSTINVGPKSELALRVAGVAIGVFLIAASVTMPAFLPFAFVVLAISLFASNPTPSTASKTHEEAMTMLQPHSKIEEGEAKSVELNLAGSINNDDEYEDYDDQQPLLRAARQAQMEDK